MVASPRDGPSVYSEPDYGRDGNLRRVPILMSYAYLKDAPDETVRAIMEDDRIELLVDSGGFTALNAGKEINLDEYCSWLKRYEEHIFGYMQLDKLGDPIESDRMLQVMLDRGLQPIPIHVWGDDATRMDQLFEWSGHNWVALGGLRRPQRGWSPKSYVKIKMKWAAGRNVHWLGYTRKEMVESFRPYSCDSSNAAAGVMWGEVMFYEGRGRWSKQMTRRKWASAGKKRPLLTPKQIRILEQCGFKHDDFFDPAQDVHTGRDLTIYSAVALVSYFKASLDQRNHVGVRNFSALGPDMYASQISPCLDITFDTWNQPRRKP